MNNYERKIALNYRESKSTQLPLELKELEENCVFEGYASVFDVVDS